MVNEKKEWDEEQKQRVSTLEIRLNRKAEDAERMEQLIMELTRRSDESQAEVQSLHRLKEGLMV